MEPNYTIAYNMIAGGDVISGSAQVYTQAFSGASWIILLVGFSLIMIYLITKKSGMVAGLGIIGSAFIIFLQNKYNIGLLPGDLAVVYGIIVFCVAGLLFQLIKSKGE